MKYLLSICILAFLIAACSQQKGKSFSSEARESAAVYDSVRNVPELAKEFNLSTKTPDDRKFIKTGNIKFKVHNVMHASERIEDLTSKYDGYLVFSKLQNRQENYKSTRISRDSLLISKQVVVENEMELRIPTEQLDSFVRELNPLVVFFDYRIIKMDDITLRFKANQRKTDRLQNYENRQTGHIDAGKGKLRETTSAEDQLLYRQQQIDDLRMSAMELEDRVKYCNLSLEIYQKPVIVQEVIPDFNYVSTAKPNFFLRAGDAVVRGWYILEEVILFLIQIWGIILLIAAIVIGTKFLIKWLKKIK
jgi:hypothetical protein